jgi:hypothetical protein
MGYGEEARVPGEVHGFSIPDRSGHLSATYDDIPAVPTAHRAATLHAARLIYIQVMEDTYIQVMEDTFTRHLDTGGLDTLAHITDTDSCAADRHLRPRAGDDSKRARLATAAQILVRQVRAIVARAA